MRRSRIDIVVEVLEVARNGINKTAIVYKTNLNFKLAEKYLLLLEKQGFLENKSEKYITTDKGKIFLGKAKEITMQLEIPIQKCKENSIHNETPIIKAKQMTSEYETPVQNVHEMMLLYNVPIERVREISMQCETPLQRV